MALFTLQEPRGGLVGFGVFFLSGIVTAQGIKAPHRLQQLCSNIPKMDGAKCSLLSSHGAD